MMSRRGRRRAAARWSYADATSLVNGPAGSLQIAFTWLLPPARVNYMLSTQGRRNSLVYSGTHLWMDFYYKMTGGNNTGMPDVDFGVIKTTISDPVGFTPDLSLVDAQWDQPSTPATITSWDEDDDSGVDSWLWQHHIKGMSPPNAYVGTYDVSGLGSVLACHNQEIITRGGSSDNPTFVCRKFHVTQEWQPDVVVRSKRRLQKDEGILLYMASQPGAGTEVTCNVHLRTLTK